MRAVLRLEFIAENYFSYGKTPGAFHPRTARYAEYLGRNQSRPWVARIEGRDETYGLKRTFMDGQIDYSQTNSVGSRGVYLYFALLDGIYEVNERTSWRHVRRYFIRVAEARYQEISREEVEAWLANAA